MSVFAPQHSAAAGEMSSHSDKSTRDTTMPILPLRLTELHAGFSYKGLLAQVYGFFVTVALLLLSCSCRLAPRGRLRPRYVRCPRNVAGVDTQSFTEPIQLNCLFFLCHLCRVESCFVFSCHHTFRMVKFCLADMTPPRSTFQRYQPFCS